ncbi:hypothetical protein SCLCIDRAFT_1214034, partial [Scleroderma citrinum Foug A]
MMSLANLESTTVPTESCSTVIAQIFMETGSIDRNALGYLVTGSVVGLGFADALFVRGTHIYSFSSRNMVETVNSGERCFVTGHSGTRRWLNTKGGMPVTQAWNEVKRPKRRTQYWDYWI